MSAWLKSLGKLLILPAASGIFTGIVVFQLTHDQPSVELIISRPTHAYMGNEVSHTLVVANRGSDIARQVQLVVESMRWRILSKEIDSMRRYLSRVKNSLRRKMICTCDVEICRRMPQFPFCLCTKGRLCGRAKYGFFRIMRRYIKRRLLSS